MMLWWPLGCLMGYVVGFLEGVHLVGAVVGVPGVWCLLLVCLLELVRGCLMGVVVGVLWPGCEGGWEVRIWCAWWVFVVWGVSGLCLG